MTSVRVPLATAPVAPPARPLLVSIQCLRGVAALLVVMLHAQGAVALKLPGKSALNGFSALGHFGSIGVDVFFVISGFIMVYVSRDRFGLRGSATDFLARRAIRIVPLYWLVTALMAILLLAVPQAFDTLKLGVGHTIASFLFLPTTNSAGEMVPVLGVGWTLSYEMLFYVVFASLLSISLRTSLVVSAILFTTAAVAGQLWPPTGATGVMLLSDRFLEFFVGECVAVWFLRHGALGSRASRAVPAIAAGALVAHVFFPDMRSVPLLTIAVPAGALVLGLLSLEQRGLLRFPRWLERTGDESYSLYLSHSITNAVFFKVCVATHISRFVPAEALIVVAIVNAMIWGRVLHRTVERPMTRALTRAWQQRSEA